MKIAKGLVGGLLVLLIVFSVLYVLYDRDYLTGGERHYIGTSAVTPDNLVTLCADGRTPSYSITSITRLDNGMAEITYDFYSEENYPFIIAAPFSYLDTSLIHTFARQADDWMVVGLAIVGAAGAFFILTRYKVSAESFAWYIMHPLYIFHRRLAPSIYAPTILQEINIPAGRNGIYATRTWKLARGYLYSSGIGQARWENKTLLANKIPSENNENGVYANRLGVIDNDHRFQSCLLGIVSLSGEWMEHADGVLRAESCEILLIIASGFYKNEACKLSSTYGVPVVIVEDTVNVYVKWVTGTNGIECLKHNAKILKGDMNGNDRKSNKEGETTSKTTVTVACAGSGPS